MLTVDLTRLDRLGRLTIEADLAADFPLWKGSDIRLDGPLAVRLEAARAGHDLLVRGRLTGAVVIQCRRCLEPVVHNINDEVSFVFRAGIDQITADLEEVYLLPAGAREIDLTEAIREHLLLSIPKFVVCREECRGLCPRCGVDLNRGSCTCEALETDERWAPFRDLKLD